MVIFFKSICLQIFVQVQSKIFCNKVLPLQLKQRQSVVPEQVENVPNTKGQVTQEETALCEWAEHLDLVVRKMIIFIQV